MAPKKKRSITHLNERGEMHMVDIGSKETTVRQAIAQSRIRLNQAARDALKVGSSKGDVFAAARLAGILAAKKTAERETGPKESSKAAQKVADARKDS